MNNCEEPRVLAIILGGGKGTRLYPLTKERSKPAVSFGGKYRIVDIPLSNCINSGYKKIYLLTQFNSASLHLHISNSYNFDRFSGGFVEILAAEHTYLKAQKGFEGFEEHQFKALLEKMFAAADPDWAKKPDIKWNFTKFVIDRQGNVVARFEPTADMQKVEDCIKALL